MIAKKEKRIFFTS